MNNLEDYIGKHRAEFDSEEPSPEHGERFRGRLKGQQPRRSLFNSRNTVAIAAAGIAIIVGLSFAVNRYNSNPINILQPQQKAISTELSPADEFYRSQINNRQQEILSYVKRNAPEKKGEVRSILKEMDKGYMNLRKDMLDWHNTEMALYTLTNHYQTQIEVLDRIASTLTGGNGNDNPIEI